MRKLKLLILALCAVAMLTSCVSEEFVKHQGDYFTTTRQYTEAGIQADESLDLEHRQLLMDVVKGQEISLRRAGAFEGAK